MKIAFNEADAKFSDALMHFRENLNVLRVGRGTLQMIEALKVDVYGQNMPINQISNVNLVDVSLITISPWDKNNIGAIIKGIQASDLGINPTQDGNIVRLPIPPLTEERRMEFVKLLNTKSEEAKVIVRQIRKDIMDTIEEQKDQGIIGEDEQNRLEKELQKKVDSTNKEIETIAKEKEKELMQI